MNNPTIRIRHKRRSISLEERRVNIQGVWFGGFSAGSHSLIDIGEAQVIREIRHKRMK